MGILCARFWSYASTFIYVMDLPKADQAGDGRLSAVELFSGAGGMALGFERAGFDVVAAVELDPLHLATHSRNFPMCEPVCGDVGMLAAAAVLDAARRGIARREPDGDVTRPIDCVFGGPSCQGFSIIGKRDPRDRRNDLVHEFTRLVIALRPRWFVLENVPGLIGRAYMDVLRRVHSDLEGGGYRVAEPWALDSSDYGVPQERKRVFIVGAREDTELPQRPAPASQKVTVSEAIDDLPELARYRSLLTNDQLKIDSALNEMMCSRQSAYVRYLNGEADDPTDLTDRRVWDRSTLTSVRLTIHSPEVITRFRRLKPGLRDSVGRLPKLVADGQSPTLRAGTGRDHGSFTSPRPVHHRSPRVVTVREAARLHGFPDWFGFHHTRWHGLRQIGNAVPPPLAYAVAAAVVQASETKLKRREEAIALGDDSLLGLSLESAARMYGLPLSMLPQNIRRPAAGRASIAPSSR